MMSHCASIVRVWFTTLGLDLNQENSRSSFLLKLILQGTNCLCFLLFLLGFVLFCLEIQIQYNWAKQRLKNGMGSSFLCYFLRMVRAYFVNTCMAFLVHTTPRNLRTLLRHSVQSSGEVLPSPISMHTRQIIIGQCSFLLWCFCLEGICVYFVSRVTDHLLPKAMLGASGMIPDQQTILVSLRSVCLPSPTPLWWCPKQT